MSGHWQECTGVQILDGDWKRNDLSCLTSSSASGDGRDSEDKQKDHILLQASPHRWGLEPPQLWEVSNLGRVASQLDSDSPKASLHNKRCLCS